MARGNEKTGGSRPATGARFAAGVNENGGLNGASGFRERADFISFTQTNFATLAPRKPRRFIVNCFAVHKQPHFAWTGCRLAVKKGEPEASNCSQRPALLICKTGVEGGIEDRFGKRETTFGEDFPFPGRESVSIVPAPKAATLCAGRPGAARAAIRRWKNPMATQLQEEICSHNAHTEQRNGEME